MSGRPGAGHFIEGRYALGLSHTPSGRRDRGGNLATARPKTRRRGFGAELCKGSPLPTDTSRSGLPSRRGTARHEHPPTHSGRRDQGASLATARPRTQAARLRSRTRSEEPDIPRRKVQPANCPIQSPYWQMRVARVFPHGEVLPGAKGAPLIGAIPPAATRTSLTGRYCRYTGGVKTPPVITAGVPIWAGPPRRWGNDPTCYYSRVSVGFHNGQGTCTFIYLAPLLRTSPCE